MNNKNNFIVAILALFGLFAHADIPDFESKYPRADKKVKELLETLYSSDSDAFFSVFIEAERREIYSEMGKEEIEASFLRIKEKVTEFLSSGPIHVEVVLSSVGEEEKASYWFKRIGVQGTDAMIIPVWLNGGDGSSQIGGGIQFYRVEGEGQKDHGSPKEETNGTPEKGDDESPQKF